MLLQYTPALNMVKFARSTLAIMLCATLTGASHIALANDANSFFKSTTAQRSSADLGSSTNSDNEFLDVDDAFSLQLQTSESGYLLEWAIAPDYYLYKRQFSVEILDANQSVTDIQLSRGLQKQDGYFGLVEVYYHHASASFRLEPRASDVQVLRVKYQGCADAGLCYPTQTREFRIDKAL